MMKGLNLIKTLAVVSLAALAITTTRAWTINTVTNQASFFEAVTENSSYSVTQYRAIPLGKNSVAAKLLIESSNSAPIWIMVQLLDENGDIIHAEGDSCYIKISGVGGKCHVINFELNEPMVFWHNFDGFSRANVSVIIYKKGIAEEFNTLMVVLNHLGPE